jgi:predicted O-methyltransferase YrrM
MQMIDMTCTLHDHTVQAFLDRAYREAKGEKLRLGPRVVLNALFGRQWSLEEYVQAVKTMYVPLSQECGTFAYQLARSIKAKRIVEFGTAFGVSTVYLAAAIKDNGGGVVIGSEMEPSKIVQVRKNLEEVGLAGYVEIREGDARKTLVDPGGTIDILLVDGHKDFYLDIVKLLMPHFRTGSVVLADNVTLGAPILRALRSYVKFMQDPQNGFCSMTLPLKDGLEYSVRL